MSPLRALLWITLTMGLALEAQAQEHWAVGKYIPGFLQVYPVSASGEISDPQIMDEYSWGNEVLLDQGGRMVCIRGEAGEIHLYRISPSRTLSLASTAAYPEGTGFTQSLALSQDGRIVLGLHVDLNANPRHFEFRTLLVNNRLQLVETGHVFDRDLIEGGISNWTITDFHPYQALVRADDLVNLSISTSGEISGPIQVHAPAHLAGGPRDWSADGRWNLRSTQSDPDLLINETLSDGMIRENDILSNGTISTVWDCMFMPNLRAVVVAATPGLFTVGLNPDMTFAGIIDQESVGFNNVACVGVSHDSRMVLACDQDVGFDFPLFSYFLDPDTAELTPTGHTLSRPDFHADLRFIPPPTLPTLMGDANVDGVVDAADLTFLINEAMPDDKPILYPQNFANADFDNDIDVDQDDLDMLIEMLLGL